jgi:hypothetical protein
MLYYWIPGCIVGCTLSNSKMFTFFTILEGDLFDGPPERSASRSMEETGFYEGASSKLKSKFTPAGLAS